MMSCSLSRRKFIAGSSPHLAGAAMAALLPGALSGAIPSAVARQIDKLRPRRLARLPSDFRARVGATHVGGKYHLTDKPFLIEGAERLLEMGTRLGKFWFNPRGIATSYPFNSRWGTYATLVDLAKSEYFSQVFAMPFETIFLEASAASEEGWQREQPDSFYEAVAGEYREIAAFFYREYRDRALTVVLQHWEGDWLLRGENKKWSPPSPDWQQRAERMARWLAARQAGVSRARDEGGGGAKCRVAHATEVNRVMDIHRGLPTVTDKVLPQVEVDLVSYSAYDGMRDAMTLYECIQTIRKHARTGPLFGKGAVCLGEIGIPENEQRERVAERWDELMGAAFAADALYVIHWELYCNEPNPKVQPPPKPPIRAASDARGFWLVRPDGTLGESGKYFSALWKRAERGM